MKTYIKTFSFSILQQVKHIGDSLISRVSLVLFILIFVSLWSSTYYLTQSGEIGGFTLKQLIWYFSITEALLLARSRIWGEISRDVKSGDIAYNLSRPYSYPVLLLFKALGNNIFFLFINLIISGILAFAFTKTIPGNPFSWISFLLLAILGQIVDVLINIIIGLLAFFFEEVEPFYWIYDKLIFTLGGLFIPLDFFPDWIQRIAKSLPTQAILYLPARTFVTADAQIAENAFFLQVIVVVLCLFVGLIIWPISLRRLEINGG